MDRARPHLGRNALAGVCKPLIGTKHDLARSLDASCPDGFRLLETVAEPRHVGGQIFEGLDTCVHSGSTAQGMFSHGVGDNLCELQVRESCNSLPDRDKNANVVGLQVRKS
ncbi:MAG: hypothetical protein RI920_33 [Pseudomonadota bacterium]|jgi:hypothetical protein